MRPEALAAMLPFLTDRFGNPSGSHSVARDATAALDESRERLARALGCRPLEVTFTSGGTEADNLAVLGVLEARPGDAVCSAIEHHAVLAPTIARGGTTTAVGADGVIDLDRLSDALGPGVSIVSVMLANNEIGTIQPLDEVAALVRERAPEAVLHTDAVHAAAWIDLSLAAACADLVSVSAHKFGGPKGVGALVVREGVKLAPVSRGGSQERGRRPGTQPVAEVVAMVAALEATLAGLSADVPRVAALRDRLADRILELAAPAEETAGEQAHRTTKVAGSFHVRFPGVDQEELLLLLDRFGVCASAGSACASGAIEPSHVLLAMGFTPSEARTAVRFSLGCGTTEADVDTALEATAKSVAQLRA